MNKTKRPPGVEKKSQGKGQPDSEQCALGICEADSMTLKQHKQKKMADLLVSLRESNLVLADNTTVAASEYFAGADCIGVYFRSALLHRDLLLSLLADVFHLVFQKQKLQ